jgi:hypothetical protein
LANSLVNALQAKRRFVESLTHYSKYGDNDNFLSPTQQPTNESPIKAETSEPSDTPHTVVKVKQESDQSKGEIQLTESEYRRIMTLLESRQKRTEKPKRSQTQESVPVWAKLAYASSNPNSRRSQYY